MQSILFDVSIMGGLIDFAAALASIFLLNYIFIIGKEADSYKYQKVTIIENSSNTRNIDLTMKDGLRSKMIR